jgi:hypothetical protein
MFKDEAESIHLQNKVNYSAALLNCVFIAFERSQKLIAKSQKLNIYKTKLYDKD